MFHTNKYIVTIIVLFVVLLISYYLIPIFTNKNKEHFNNDIFKISTKTICPNKLIFNGKRYELYVNDQIQRIFTTYTDYLNYWKFMSKSFEKKGIICPPLYPNEDRTNKSSSTHTNNTKELIDINRVSPKLYNIEYFVSQTDEYPRTPDKTVQDHSIPIQDKIESNLSMKNLDTPIYNDTTGCCKLDLPKHIPQINTNNHYTDIPVLNSANVIMNRKREMDKILTNYINQPNNSRFKQYLTDTNSVIYNAFQTSFNNYINMMFKQRFDTIPECKDLDNMEPIYADYYLTILKTLPDIEKLLESIPIIDSSFNKSEFIPPVPTSNRDIYTSLKPYFNQLADSLKSTVSTLEDIYNEKVRIPINKAGANKYKTFENKIRQEAKLGYIAEPLGYTYSYKPDYYFDHMQPSKNIAIQYGWSYMPPQLWSVPQKRAPVCIPASQNDTETIQPMLDKSVPTNAVAWNDTLPMTVFDKEFNADYYYPGYISMKSPPNYPFPQKSENFWNLREAEPLKGKM